MAIPRWSLAFVLLAVHALSSSTRAGAMPRHCGAVARRGCLQLLFLVAMLLYLSWVTPAHAAVTESTASDESAATLARRQMEWRRSAVAYVERVGAVMEYLAGLSSTLTLASVAEDGAAASGAPPTSSATDVSIAVLQAPQVALRSVLGAVATYGTGVMMLGRVIAGYELPAAETELLAASARRADWISGGGFEDMSSSLDAGGSHQSPPVQQHQPDGTNDGVAGAAVDDAGRHRQTASVASTISSSIVPCSSGLNAVSSDAQFNCRGRLVSAAAYKDAIADSKASCKLVNVESVEQQCVCPMDHFLTSARAGSYTCLRRVVDAEVLLDEKLLCYMAESAALGLAATVPGEYCIEMERRGLLEAQVTVKYRYLSGATSGALMSPAKSALAVTEVPERGGEWILLRSGEMGSYAALSSNSSLFTYELKTVDADGAPFYSSKASLLKSITQYSSIFSFSSPRFMVDHHQSLALYDTNSNSYLSAFASGTGQFVYKLAYNLSDVSDAFVEGGQMYLETGLQGGGILYDFRAARLHISFTDVAPPSPKSFVYPKRFDVLYIFAISVAVAAVVIVALAVLWYCCMKPEEMEDKLVSRLHRHREAVFSADQPTLAEVKRVPASELQRGTANGSTRGADDGGCGLTRFDREALTSPSCNSPLSAPRM